MHPQAPPAPSPAALSQHQHHPRAPPPPLALQQQHQPFDDTDSYQYTSSSEKDALQRQQFPSRERGSKASTARGHDSVISHPFSPKPSTPPSPSSSISSARRNLRPTSEIQQSPAPNVTFPPQAHIDPEKAQPSQYSQRASNRHSSSNPEVTAIVYDSGEYHEKEPEEKAWLLLFYLSGPCAMLSLFITIWTLFALLIALALQPIRLFNKKSSLSSQLVSFLAPPLNLQLHLVYSYNSATDYSTPMLVIVNLFSSVVAFGVAIAAWTAACFWFFSAILGDPAGQDGHNDGKESIIGVRNWWERWLSRALR